MKRVWLAAIALMALSGCINRDAIYANPPPELLKQLDLLLPAANRFVEESEAAAMANGVALDDKQQALARSLGIREVERVRVYYVDALPSPTDPQLLPLAKRYGYSSPAMGAYTYGYGIWIKTPYRHDRELLAHELVHVHQGERLGREVLTRQYLMQLFIYGYNNAPLELEAYRIAGSLR